MIPITAANVGKAVAALGALGAAAATSQPLITRGYIHGAQLPAGEIVVETDNLIVERSRPNYSSAVHVGAVGVGAALFIIGAYMGPSTATALRGIAASALAGAGVGVITGAVGAASLFNGAVIRKFPP